MKKQLITLLLLLGTCSFGQNSAIGTTDPHPSSAYEIHSTTGGFLPPRMTQEQRDALQTPAKGLLIYNITSECQEFYNGTTWFNLCNGGPSFKIVTQPIAPSPTCAGDGIQTLNVVASGNDLTYSWRKNGVALANNTVVNGQNTPTLTLINPQLSDAGNYEVLVSDASWAVASYTVPVVVYNTSITKISGEQIAIGPNYTLTAYAPEATINWYATPTGGTILFSGAQFTFPTSSNAITYYAEATVGGCVSPSRTPVTVSTPLVIGAAGKIWMAYNQGATNIATSATDYTQYGSLYQWGRGSDGHQLIQWTSATTGTPVNGKTSIVSTADYPSNNGLFITTSAEPHDWRSPQNDNLWQGVEGINNPCPTGFRLPTEVEWTNEAIASGIKNTATAYYSILKLLGVGIRLSNGFYDYDDKGFYWTSTVAGIHAKSFHFNKSSSMIYTSYRADANSIRCIKD